MLKLIMRNFFIFTFLILFVLFLISGHIPKTKADWIVFLVIDILVYLPLQTIGIENQRQQQGLPSGGRPPKENKTYSDVYNQAFNEAYESAVKRGKINRTNIYSFLSTFLDGVPKKNFGTGKGQINFYYDEADEYSAEVKARLAAEEKARHEAETYTGAFKETNGGKPIEGVSGFKFDKHGTPFDRLWNKILHANPKDTQSKFYKDHSSNDDDTTWYWNL